MADTTTNVTITPAASDRRVMVRLRVSLAQASEAAQRLDLPSRVGASSGTDPHAYGVGPDFWLLISHKRTADELITRCHQALDGLVAHATDASDALTCLEVSGAGSRSLLGMASGVDFDPKGFKPGACARTRFARVATLVVALPQDGDCFELYVDRSVGAYLADWLRNATSDPMFTVLSQAARGLAS